MFSTNSIYHVLFIDLDVSKVLRDYFPTKIYYVGYIQSLDFSITSIVLPNWTCNDLEYTVFDISQFSKVKSIEIGDECFESVQTFKIDGLNRLKTIKIGKNSFTRERNSYGDDQSKSFHILNCDSLKSIQIGEYSFSDFGGEFELKNCPQLRSIQIGSTESDSYNFSYSSFVLQGIELIMKM